MKKKQRIKLRNIARMYFGLIDDQRYSGNVIYSLTDILIIVMCGILCGLDELNRIVEYSKSNKKFLNKIFKIQQIPSKATISRVLSIIDPNMAGMCIVGIIKSIVGKQNKQHVATDGKCIRETEKISTISKMMNIVTAYSVNDYISLNQITVYEKTNEIPMVPELLNILNIKNTIVSMDALHCQKNTTKEIVARGGDYVIGLKENQKMLYDEVKMAYEDVINSTKPVDREVYSKYEIVEKNRDRNETRIGYLLKDISWISNKKDWTNLNNVICIKRVIERNEKVTEELSFYITSLKDGIQEIMEHVRKHWHIESMHHILDVTYKEDACGIFSKKAQETLNIFRKLGITFHKNFLAKTKSRVSVRENMFKCLVDSQFLTKFLNNLEILQTCNNS